MTREEENLLSSMQRDQCPKCFALGLRPGPRGGESQNLFCDGCKSGFNVALPRLIYYVESIPWSPPH